MKQIRFFLSNRGGAFFSRLYVGLYPFFLFFVLELMNPGSVSTSVNILGLALPNPFTRAPYAAVMSGWATVLFSLLAIYLLILLVFALWGDLFAASGAVSLFLYALYAVSFYRKLISGMVLTPAELGLAGDLATVMSLDRVPIDKHVIITAFLILIGLVPLFLMRRQFRVAARRRMLLFSVALGVGLFLFGTIPAQRFLFERLGVSYGTFKTTNNAMYRNYGVMLGFYMTTQYGNLDAIFNTAALIEAIDEENAAPLDRIGAPEFPEQYNADYMARLISDIKEEMPVQKTVSPTEKPNVIVIMSEAFSDPTTWDNIIFSTDPVPTLHALQQTATHGRVVSPEIAGRTCNPEFEFLTGFPMYFTASGDIPMEQPEKYIPAGDKRALAHIFKANGYYTAAVHTFRGSFYNRDTIYPQLGFDAFYSIEDMPDAPLKGRFASDAFFTDQIIKQLEQSQDPAFIFGISMENHFEYFPGKFQELSIHGYSDRLNDFQLACADSYLQGVYDADHELGRLIDYLAASPKPTIVYFFGDHLPLLGESSSIYTALGYVGSGDLSEWTLAESERMFTTPYVLWANYTLPAHDWADMSPYFIGPLLLDLAGLDRNFYFDFLGTAYDQFHAMKQQLYVNGDGQYYSTPLLQDKTVLDRFYYLNYDHTFGDRYAAEAQAAVAGQP